MITTAIIAFREFLEAFLIVGVFLGISNRLGLRRHKEILLASGIGIVISLLLTVVTYLFGDMARGVLTEERADLLESYLQIFSGLFIAYVVLSLHTTINKSRGKILLAAHSKLKDNAFDLSLFLTIIFLVIREGFEIALFTASTSLFSDFAQNLLGLIIGLICSGLIGLSTFIAFLRFPVGKVMKATQYMIVLVGASLIQNGFTLLFEIHFGIHLSNFMSLGLNFLPDEHTLLGHFLHGIFGIDSQFSLPRLWIMLVYIAVVYFLFLKTKRKSTA